MGRAKTHPYWEYEELCKKNGISKRMFVQRVWHGMPHLEAATRPFIPHRERIKPNQVIMPDMRRTAEENGIGINTLQTRIHKYAWDEEDAITRPIDVKSRRKSGYEKTTHHH